jgi:hypothetical protein
LLIAALVVLLLRRRKKATSIAPQDDNAIVGMAGPEKFSHGNEMDSVQRYELEVPRSELPAKEEVYAELPEKRH